VSQASERGGTGASPELSEADRKRHPLLRGRTLSRPLAVWHHARLREALREIILDGKSAVWLSDMASVSIARGLPIDPEILIAPESVLAQEARRTALCIPSLRSLHQDCRAWLAHKLRNWRRVP
jgi:hypothetical protein